MRLESGSRLGNYEILDPLGAGGMGEVYRARDRKLERDVAIKILPEEFARDAERLARFEREAKLLASVNHPAIATLHGLEEDGGVQFLVMELVEGETLADRIARGPQSIGDAVPLFVQIADALEAAHDRGVIHRDLKPGNIMITPEERIKVLDFGLAKAWQGGAPDDGASQSPTLTRGSATGEILGTAAYMSPEQARGKPIDKRTDLWALGVVLYEALTGKRLFRGEDVSETLAFVLTKEVDWSALPASTPSSLRRLLRRTLERDRRRRLADAADARLELEEGTSSDDVERARGGFAWRWAIGFGVGAIAAGLLLWPGTRPRASAIARLAIVTSLSEPVYSVDASQPALAITPDGSRIVYFVSAEGGQELRVRALDSDTALTLASTPRHTMGDPFVSPDGEWVGFVESNELKRVSIHGGASTTICSVPGDVSGVSWGDDDTIVFAVPRRGLFAVAMPGGDVELLVAADTESGRFYRPHVLPGSRAVLFSARPGPGTKAWKILAHDLHTDSRTVLIEGGTAPHYVSTGHLAYIVDGQLQAVPFDVEGLRVTDGPRALNERARDFTISDSGVLAYLPASIRSLYERTLVWVDEAGRPERLDHPPNGYFDVALAPDGSMLATDIVPIDVAGVRDIWVYDVARGARTRLTFDGGAHPVWTPDSLRVAFNIPNRAGIYWQRVDGSKDAELLVEDGWMPNSWSPDGRILAFTRSGDSENGSDIWMLPLGGEPEPFIRTVHEEDGPMFSPDGRFLAYVSDETGMQEVYLRPFPGPGPKVPVSVGGGRAPVWSPDGSKIFYRSVEPPRIKVVSVDTERKLVVGAPKTILNDRFVLSSPGDPHYDVSHDGRSLLLIDEGAGADGAVNQVNVVLNWFSELERLVPVR